MAKKEHTLGDSPQTRLATALRRVPKETLADLLAELAQSYPEVSERLERYALSHDLARLANVFRARLEDWKHPKRFRGRGAAADFGRELQAWLDEIERELLPLDAAQALQLAEAFLGNDAAFFKQADDSDAAIGDAIRAACRLWLLAAKAQGNRHIAHWVEQVYTLVATDQYGARDALLKHADLLFEEPGLRALAQRYETDLDEGLAAREAGRREHGTYRAAAAIELIADALGDPDLSTRTALRINPEPDLRQREHLAQRYLRCARPREALAWLEGDGTHAEEASRHLLAEIYAALGETERLREVRRVLFELSGSLEDFEAWKSSLAPAEQASATELARARAQVLDDPVAAARLLLALDDAAAAEELLIARRASVRGESYYHLVSLAQALENQRPRAAIVCYRALLLAILGRAYARAYGHAADYLRALRRLHTQLFDYGVLETHEAFEASIRHAHPRKVAFWSRL